MAVQSATFVQDTILFLKAALKSALTDPLSRSDNSFVMTSYPKKTVQYPIITIKNTNIDTKKLGMSSEISYTKQSIEIRAWARNAKESDDLCQDVINALRDIEYTTSTGTVVNNLYGFKLQSCNSVVETNEENTIHSKVLNFSYAVVLGE